MGLCTCLQRHDGDRGNAKRGYLSVLGLRCCQGVGDGAAWGASEVLYEFVQVAANASVKMLAGRIGDAGSGVRGGSTWGGRYGDRGRRVEGGGAEGRFVADGGD